MVDVGLVPLCPLQEHDFGGSDAWIGGGPTALQKARPVPDGEFAFFSPAEPSLSQLQLKESMP